MQKIKIVLPIILLLFFMLSSTAIVGAQEQKIIAAVMELEAKEGIPVGTVFSLSDYLRIQLVNTEKFNIVTRENMEQILKEQNFQLSGCTSQECVIQMGQLLGVNKMFTGTIGKIGKTYLLTLKIINIENGKIEKAVIEECPKCEEDALLVSMKNIVNKIIGLPTLEKTPQKVAKKEEQKIEPVMPPKIERTNKNYWEYYTDGLSFSEAGKWEEAINTFQKAISMDTKDRSKTRTYGMHFIEYFPHRELGIVYFHLKQIEKAKEELEKSLSMEKSPKAQEYLKLME